MSKNKSRRAKKREEVKKKKEIIKQLNSKKMSYEKAFALLDELKVED